MSTATEQIFLPSPSGVQDQPGLPKPGNGPQPVNLDSVKEFSKVCRVCAAVSELVMPIFSGEGLQNNLADKIHRHLPIKVSESDSPSLPVVVCYQCAGTLLAAHELAQCAAQADAALRTRSAALARAARSGDSLQATKEEETVEDDEQARRCAFCPRRLARARYRAHLERRHAALVFHCAECDRYLSRRVLLLHMSAHAAHYDAAAATAQPQATSTSPKADPASDSTPTSSKPVIVLSPVTVPTPATASAPAPVTASLPETAIAPAGGRDEFSDPSDAESEFGPLPDSVFTAIEDPPDAVPPPAEEGKTEAGKGRKRERACPHCDKKYSAASSYFYHLKHAHRRSREHACGVCGAAFGTRGTLREHERLHSAERALQCARCGKRYRSKAGLYIHAQTHGGAASWQCGECGRAFRWRAALRRHAARHEGARAHACPAPRCARAFSVRADLLRHARTHAPPPARLACPQPACAATFAQPRYLRAHLTKKHPAAT